MKPRKRRPPGERPLPTRESDKRAADEENPARPKSFQERLAEEVKHPRSLKEHPEGSAPPLDRLTQDLDPRKELKER